MGFFVESEVNCFIVFCSIDSLFLMFKNCFGWYLCESGYKWLFVLLVIIMGRKDIYFIFFDEEYWILF